MDIKKNEELLAETYRNCQLALESISDILPAIEDEQLKNEILRQHEEYEKISAEASILSKNLGVKIKEPNPVKKAMMWGSIKMNTLIDNTKANIASMMAQGTVMGITSLKSSLAETEDYTDEEVKELCKKLIEREEEFEETLKGYIS